MRELDLHGLPVADALRTFVDFHNNVVRHRTREAIRVVHGYGSSGQGGKIRQRIRELLAAAGESVEWDAGEDIENNPGVTIVYPRKLIHAREDQLAAAILEFCSTPRTESKIAGHFRSNTAREIKQTIRALVRRGELTEITRADRTVFHRRDAEAQRI